MKKTKRNNDIKKTKKTKKGSIQKTKKHIKIKRKPRRITISVRTNQIGGTIEEDINIELDKYLEIEKDLIQSVRDKERISRLLNELELEFEDSNKNISDFSTMIKQLKKTNHTLAKEDTAQISHNNMLITGYEKHIKEKNEKLKDIIKQLKTYNDFFKDSSKTNYELNFDLNMKKEEIKTLLNENVDEINEMTQEKQNEFLLNIKKILKIEFSLHVIAEKAKSESNLLEKIKIFNKGIQNNKHFASREIEKYKTEIKLAEDSLQESYSLLEKSIIPKQKQLHEVIQQFKIRLNDELSKDDSNKDNSKITKMNEIIDTKTKEKHDIEMAGLELRKNIMTFKENRQFCLLKILEIEGIHNQNFEIFKNQLLTYINTNIMMVGKILFERPVTNMETKNAIEEILSLCEISINIIKTDYEKTKSEKTSAQMVDEIANQRAIESANKLIEEEEKAKAIKKTVIAKQKTNVAKPKPKAITEATSVSKQQMVLPKQKEEQSVKQKQPASNSFTESFPVTAEEKTKVAKEKSLTESFIKKQEQKKKKATISKTILNYWRPIMKDYLNIPPSQDINIIDELLNIKQFVKQMIIDDVLPESGITSNSCKELLKIIKNYSGIEKGFQGTFKNITRETCMICIVMALIGNILEKTKVGILLLKGSASIQIYTEKIKQIQDLDFIIMPYMDTNDKSSMNAEQQKELAFQITSLVIWLLSDPEINLLLINTFKNTSDRIPKQLMNIDDAKQFKIMINDENKQLFDSLQIDKGDNVKIVLSLPSSTEGEINRYYPVVDIGYGFDMFEPGLKKIYRENNEKTIPSSTDSGLSFNYLKMEGLFDEICYHSLSYYFSGKEAENSFYISKVAGYLSVILPLTDGYVCDPTKPVEVETCVINIILQNLNEIYYEYLLGLYPTTSKDELKPIFKNIINGIYNNKKTQFVNKIVDKFFTS